MTGDGSSPAISGDEVAYVARLARLELSAGEVERFAGELSAILEHVEAVRRLDTAEAAPMSHVVEVANVLRPDELQPCLDRSIVLAAAPAVESDRFKVPRILGEQP